MKIEILGKEREFEFSLYTIGKVISQADITVSELGKALQGSNHFLLAKPVLQQCGGLKDEEAESFLKNNIYGQDMMSIMLAFSESMSNYLPEVETDSEVSKKK